ncbi:ribonuclease P protein component [Phormidium yuhuli AB48]|uniref:Ribonuclease P protein component n=1 Tax=Phormidium yuhuli AB48 TaxID=2940671 RepID=A0ABY5ARE5_9CYAN|nr:ribonuclease P protein component [Phormidium yuhuli]USR91471.1 ribonuclease P protein component [Phormidium yuhuli AB48]
MLPKAHRLRHWKDFQTVYRRGHRARARVLGLRAYRQSQPETEGNSTHSVPPTRFGISVGRKISKKAVVRNQIKRRLRAALRQLLPRVQPGWDVIVIAYPEAKECNSRHFLQELEQLLARVEVLNGHSRGSLL